MKKLELPYALKSVSTKLQLVIASIMLVSATSFAQVATTNENNQIPWSNSHFVYEEQPTVSVYVSAEAAAALPSALVEDNLSEINDVTVWDNTAENHLLVMVVNTVRKDLTAVVFDANGNRAMLETPVDPGSYRMVEHTRDLKPGTYFLHIMEKGKIIEKQKFAVK
ncbi:MAG: hypothetical protein WCO54_02225 [Bacteroidota bacterium]